MLGLRRIKALLLLIVWILEVSLYLPSLQSIVAYDRAILTWVDKYLEGCCRGLPEDAFLIFVYADQDVQPIL